MRLRGRLAGARLKRLETEMAGILLAPLEAFGLASYRYHPYWKTMAIIPMRMPRWGGRCRLRSG